MTRSVIYTINDAGQREYVSLLVFSKQCFWQRFAWVIGVFVATGKVVRLRRSNFCRSYTLEVRCNRMDRSIYVSCLSFFDTGARCREGCCMAGEGLSEWWVCARLQEGVPAGADVC